MKSYGRATEDVSPSTSLQVYLHNLFTVSFHKVSFLVFSFLQQTMTGEKKEIRQQKKSSFEASEKMRAAENSRRDKSFCVSFVSKRSFPPGEARRIMQIESTEQQRIVTWIILTRRHSERDANEISGWESSINNSVIGLLTFAKPSSAIKFYKITSLNSGLYRCIREVNF